MTSNLAKQYQQKTDKQHILDNPDTYIGSVEKTESNMWVYDDSSNKIILKPIEYIPGLYKLVDEGIVNCRDHVIRMIQSPLTNKKFVSFIETTIHPETGAITLMNDGNGIDIERHPENNLWIPEMVFGHLRTSTNYNKEEKKIVGGKNGFGFKLVLIWSTYGMIETVDHTRGLKYVQEFKNNLGELCPPIITKTKEKPYTRVTFIPDYTRLGIQGLTPDMIALLKKRVYDIGAVTNHSIHKIRVSYNQTPIPVKNFQQYIDLYLGDKAECKRIYEAPDERWEYAVALSTTHEFMQVSFVNGICTFKGGKHVDYIMSQITKKVGEYIEKKKKVKVNPNAIKEQLILFLRCDIENPSFDSQTKDYMNTAFSNFGSRCSISDSFIEKVAKMGVMDLACTITEAKETRLAKKTDGSKTKNIRGIANLIDANFAGTTNSKDCILIPCEGLSALSGIVSGLSSNDRNTIGIYPLKGKLLNVRGEQKKKIAENKEISDLKKILGLESGKEYKTMEDVHRYLRYGKIMILCDQDMDGSHIKGLFINLFHSEWSSLIQIPGFISFMNTPILRAKHGNKTLVFYNEGEYARWKNQIGDSLKHWTIKYFKGLGTSTATEFKEYFANKKIVDFVYTGPESDNTIDMIFNKKRADDRKRWLEKYDKHVFLDTSQLTVNYEQFIDHEMIHFSTYDCARSIPNMVDGLKISLRKILYSAFKRKLTSEIKVAQFSGYVSEHSAYHHGEASLNGAIIHMAQNYVGSNNIHLLEPRGQFGTRLNGGNDSASERYIYTCLNPITRLIFPEVDDAVLVYLNDDGSIVEPEYYVPIIPFALINGIKGIGTGFSCNIPAYNPIQIIHYLKDKLNGLSKKECDFVPYYQGFKGTITKLTASKYLVRGVYEKINASTIRITELPVGTSTLPYISFLEGLMDGTVDKNGHRTPPQIKDMTNLSTESIVDITVVFLTKEIIGELESHTDSNGINGLEKLLDLTTTISTTNMYMYTAKCQLHKYESVEEIIDDFYTVRMNVYEKRKEYLIQEMKAKLVKLSNRAKYILMTLDGSIDLRRKNTGQVQSIMVDCGFDMIDGDFRYLIKMPMDSVTDENVQHILKEEGDTAKELETLISTTLETMWLNELEELERKYHEFIQKSRVSSIAENGAGGVEKRKIKVKKPVK